MRFTFAIILAVAAASASSISARTIGDSNSDGCPPECWVDGICLSCPSGVCNYRFCRKVRYRVLLRELDQISQRTPRY
ncbi:hypothetical protein EV424DRAFT_1426956 [Suillus variegatus]|nr:hypothetical protein EV424DRAFT_1426956 [Suillus variegatus]